MFSLLYRLLLFFLKFLLALGTLISVFIGLIVSYDFYNRKILEEQIPEEPSETNKE